MPTKLSNQRNLQRETLRKLQHHPTMSTTVKQLAMLKVAFSEDSKLLTSYVANLVSVQRIYPRHLPTQASGRWSTLDPPITNWPRQCIEPSCQKRLQNEIYGVGHVGYIEHEWTDHCWSIRDILLPDDDEILVSWDHDNIEGKIHDIIVNNVKALKAHREGLDLHTITCCTIFGYPLPSNLHNPHTSCDCTILGEECTDTHMSGVSGVPNNTDTGVHRCVHCLWRSRVNWQGKDTKQRVLAKNFNHGSKYTESYKFVHRIKGIEQYGIAYEQLEELAKVYIKANQEAWDAKLAIMADIRKEKMARSLYGFRRKFFTSDAETGREGFSHMISGTVSDYNNQTILAMDSWIGDSCTLLHNAHDGDKFAIKKAWLDVHYSSNIDQFKSDLRGIVERPISYQGRTLVMTAGMKVHV